jgi:hypothetical protein
MLAALAHAALDQVADAQLLADLLERHRPAPVGERGIAGDDQEPAQPRQLGDDVLGDAVGEVILLRLAAGVHEGQDGDGRALCARRGRYA